MLQKSVWDTNTLLEMLRNRDSTNDRKKAASQLGKVSTSNLDIVKALITVKKNDNDFQVRGLATESLDASVHQKVLQQNPDLQESAASAPIFPFDTSRLLIERIAFILTTGIILASILAVNALLANEAGERILRVTLVGLIAAPLILTIIYLMVFFVFGFAFQMTVGSIYAEFEYGEEIPTWATKQFSWQRYGMEFVYFLGIILAVLGIGAFASLIN